MPQIIITTDGPGDGRSMSGGGKKATGHGATEVHRERIVPADFETEAASSLLIERIGWALSDADQLEHSQPR